MICNCTVADMWVDVVDRLPEDGQEVLCYFVLDPEDVESDGKPYPYYCTLTYYKKGSIIDYAMDYDIANPEERFLDMLQNPKNENKAIEDGFYVVGDVNYMHKPTIIAWMPLERPRRCVLD